MARLSTFMSPDKIRILKTAGMHKVAAALEKVTTGRDVEEITLDKAVGLIGEKVYESRESFRKIAACLLCLDKVNNGR